MSSKRMLNLGCGNIFHPDWVNMDLAGQGSEVIPYDLRLGIPFADDSFDVVYHSHLLEYMPKAWAEFFITECHRVLRSGGVLRVVVPDLENIARSYIESIEAKRKGEDGAGQKHQWMLLEMLDRLSRQQAGGEMLNYFKQKPIPQAEFVQGRIGAEMHTNIDMANKQATSKPKTALPPMDAHYILSSDMHKWMYDALSLTKLLEESNFVDIRQCAHNESYLPEIVQYGFDSQDGMQRKPSSVIVEAKKPFVKSIENKEPYGVIFSTTDAGGAGITSLRLHNAINDIGVKHHAYVLNQQAAQSRVHLLPAKDVVQGGGLQLAGGQGEKCVRRELIAYEQNLANIIRAHPNRPLGTEHFSVPGQSIPLQNVPLLDDFDILHFHWVAGMIDPSLCLEYLIGKKIVWTLHDMNAFTGGCHYSNGCNKFESICEACPELGSTKKDDLANQTWTARMQAYAKLDMHIVAPSEWLAKQARKSSLFRNFPVQVIPYSHPVDVYKPFNKKQIRASLGLNPDHLILFFSSQSLTNVRKGGIYLVQLLHQLAQTPLKDKITVLLLGYNVSPEFSSAGIHTESFGFMENPTHMIPLYNAADATLVPSLEDNQPNVIAESLACGTPVIAFANTGMQEMIKHGETGFLAETKNMEQLLQGVLWANKARQNSITQRLCRAHALERWTPSKGAQMYVELYRSLMNK